MRLRLAQYAIKENEATSCEVAMQKVLLTALFFCCIFSGPTFSASQLRPVFVSDWCEELEDVIQAAFNDVNEGVNDPQFSNCLMRQPLTLTQGKSNKQILDLILSSPKKEVQIECYTRSFDRPDAVVLAEQANGFYDSNFPNQIFLNKEMIVFWARDILKLKEKHPKEYEFAMTHPAFSSTVAHEFMHVLGFAHPRLPYGSVPGITYKNSVPWQVGRCLNQAILNKYSDGFKVLIEADDID